ncbi:MAG: flagellar hook-associated protein 1, partial [Nocardioidaceae bacterium]|nr:flagellar hook-associated protein 1 [Nocardioidaceae bacterium]
TSAGTGSWTRAYEHRGPAVTGSFSSINTALTALRYNRVAMDTASQNIANVNTDGYTRRRVESATAGTPTTPAMWSRSQDAGSGVRITGTSRLTDAFIDARVRSEHGKQSYLDVRSGVLDRLDTGIGEPSDNGLSAMMADFRQSWSDLANSPSTSAARTQVIAKAQALVTAVAAQANNFSTEAGDQRTQLNGMVQDVNSIASDLAGTNKAIAAASLDGSDAGNLLDQRDQLALRLSELTGGKAAVNAAGGLDFSVNGVALVTGGLTGTLQVATGVTASGAADGNPVTFQISDPINGTTAVPAGVGGGIGGVTDLLDKTIPGYVAGLNAVVTTLADQVNTLHENGYDKNGAPGAAFFSYDPTDPSGTLTVAITQPDQLAASSLPGGVVDGANADALSGLTDAESAYQQLVTGFGAAVASEKQVTASQQALTDQVDGSHEQLAGVDLDEETLSLVQYQRGYEAAARVLTTVDSMLDTLINHTGLVG